MQIQYPVYRWYDRNIDQKSAQGSIVQSATEKQIDCPLSCSERVGNNLASTVEAGEWQDCAQG